MKNKKTILIISLIILAISAGGLWYFQNQTSNNQEIFQEQEGGEEVVNGGDEGISGKTQDKLSNNFGIVEGSLSYPSEIIPQLEICAENIETLKEYCTSEYITDNKYIYNKGYKITLPQGKYYIYARDSQNRRAYYSDFVICGFSATCFSHEPVLVNVVGGEILSHIDPQDWYAQN